MLSGGLSDIVADLKETARSIEYLEISFILQNICFKSRQDSLQSPEMAS
jgi:hypothetical protein